MTTTPTTRTIVLTTAPAAYDYSYVEDFGDHEVELYPGRMITVRMVTMPTSSVAYQTGRYESGLYFVRIGEVVEEEIDPWGDSRTLADENESSRRQQL